MNDTGKSRWLELDNSRSTFLTKCERLSLLTIPSVCPPMDYNDKSDTLSYDYQSFGATSTNFLQNKLMLTLFAPSRPFFRLEVDKNLQQLLEANTGGALTKQVLEDQLSIAERLSVKKLDAMNLRSKLSQVITNLIVVGNCLFELNDKKSRVYNIRKWVCKRDVYGDVIELLIKETLPFEQLSEDIQNEPSVLKLNKNKKSTVELIKWIKKNQKGEFNETQWVEDIKLPKKYDGKYNEDTLPYIVLTWTLPDGCDYGIGHVEKVAGTLEQLSILERARVNSAVLASEFRWFVSPSGVTQVEDLEESENGAVISGSPNDVNIISSGTTTALPAIDTQITSIKTELGRFFLLAEVRNAERVTAEEIRLQAQQLENSLGGAYTNIANELQQPLARFLLNNIDNPIKLDKKGMRVVIVTGLDALSRNGDIDNMNSLLSNLANVSQLPPSIQQVMNMKEVFNFYSANYGVSIKDILLSDEQIQANIQMQQRAQMNGADGPPPGIEPKPVVESPQ